MPTIDQKLFPTVQLGSRLEFETLFSDLSSRFINLRPDEVDREIEGALRSVCELLGIDLAVLWQWSGPADVIAATHSFALEGLQTPGELRQEQFPWYREQMLAGCTVTISSLQDFPPAAAIDRESCRLFGIKSNICLSLSAGGQPVGALGLSTLRAERAWPDTLVKRLQLVAQVLGNALARKRYELTLQESEARMGLAADSAEAGLWTLDYTTGVFWVTERARAIFGYSTDEVVDLKRLEASIHPEDWDLVREAIERSRRYGDPVHVEYRITRSDDRQIRWISSRARCRPHLTGEPESLMGVSIDVTEHKLADETLRASEARLAVSVELAGLAFYEVNFETGIAFVDDRFRSICGLPPEREGGIQPVHFWIEQIHPDDRQRVLDLRSQLHDGKIKLISTEYRFLHPVHGERWLRHEARVGRRDSDGRTLMSYGVFRDITESRRAEEALRKSYAEIERLKDRLQAESDYLKAEIRVMQPQGEITGQSPAIKKVLYLAEQVAGTDSLVLVHGETGSGKELVAEAIHRLSRRKTRLMVKVNCAALPAGLVESELFGREIGAFTGAMTRQIGRFEAANGSTLFLDEISEVSLEVQAKLLRVLETGQFERLGSPKTIKVDVRLIAATNRDLSEEIKKGRFREDLYYRLNVFPIRVPPLRERVEDIPPLVWTFLQQFNSRMGKKITQVPRAAMEALQRHTWPGNVRELRNVIEHAAILTTGDTLRAPVLAEDMPAAAPALSLADAEREYILHALEKAGGHIKGPKGAAASLGLKPSTLYARMEKLGIRTHRQTENGSG